MSHGRWLLSSPLRRAQRGPGQPGRSQAPSHCTIVQRPSEDKGLAVGLGLAGRARLPASLPLPGHSGPCPQPSEQEGASPPPASHPSLSKARPPAPRPSPQEPALGPAPPPAGLTADSHTAIRPSLGLQDPPVPTSSSRDAAPKPSGSAQGHQSPAWCSLGTVLQAWLQSGSLAPDTWVLPSAQSRCTHSGTEPAKCPWALLSAQAVVTALPLNAWPISDSRGQQGPGPHSWASASLAGGPHGVVQEAQQGRLQGMGRWYSLRTGMGPRHCQPGNWAKSTWAAGGGGG